MRRLRAVTSSPSIRDRSLGRLRAAALVALVAAGFVFQGLLPGLDLALRGSAFAVTLAAKTGICHAPPSDGTERTAVPAPVGNGEGQDDHGCCLVCQAASPAKGALPSPTFKVPTAGTAGLRIAATTSARMDGQVSRHRLARGPPPAATA